MMEFAMLAVPRGSILELFYNLEIEAEQLSNQDTNSRPVNFPVEIKCNIITTKTSY